LETTHRVGGKEGNGKIGGGWGGGEQKSAKVGVLEGWARIEYKVSIRTKTWNDKRLDSIPGIDGLG